MFRISEQFTIATAYCDINGPLYTAEASCKKGQHVSITNEMTKFR